MDLKGVLPYAAIQKSVTTQGEDSGYQFQLSDFSDVMLDGANSLGWSFEQFQRALHQWGDEKRALRSMGLSVIPDTAERAFEKLSDEWRRRGLDTALKVVHAYQLSDVIPLLRISQEREAFVLNESQAAPFHDHPTISSFAFNQMMRSGTRGSNAMVLHPLGPVLSQLIRKHITGGCYKREKRMLNKCKG